MPTTHPHSVVGMLSFGMCVWHVLLLCALSLYIFTYVHKHVHTHVYVNIYIMPRPWLQRRGWPPCPPQHPILQQQKPSPTPPPLHPPPQQHARHQPLPLQWQRLMPCMLLGWGVQGWGGWAWLLLLEDWVLGGTGRPPSSLEPWPGHYINVYIYMCMHMLVYICKYI